MSETTSRMDGAERASRPDAGEWASVKGAEGKSSAKDADGRSSARDASERAGRSILAGPFALALALALQPLALGLQPLATTLQPLGPASQPLGPAFQLLAPAIQSVSLAAQSGGVSLSVGTRAPDAELETLEGEAVSLLDHVEEGKPALIEFWASWCEQCEAIQPQLDEIQARYGDRMSIVAVAVGVSQSPRRVRRHLEDHDPGYTFLFDARGNAVRAYAAATTSIVVMLDEDGNVAYTGVGTEQELIGAVERLVGS